MTKTILTHKIHIKPNKTICKLLDNYFGYSRHIYNRGLALWNDEYLKGNKPNGRKIRDIIKSNPLEWYSLSPQVLDTSIEDLDKAFKMFYRKIAKYPKFKSKRNEKKSCRFCRKNDSSIRIKGNKLYLSKFPYGIKMMELPRFNGTIKTCTISKKADRYYASLTIELSNELVKTNSKDYCGIDLGLKTFVVLSDNIDDTYESNYPSKIKAYYAKRDMLNKKLSKKVKGSNRFNVMKTKLQRTYVRIHDLQQDYLQKLTTWIIRKYGIITIEDLNVKGMLKLRKLSGKVYQSLFYHFKVLLQYKSKLYGNKLVIADRWFPSTQLCNCCGQSKYGDAKLKLSDRTYTCECGYTNDRDVNASLNLRDYGLINN